MVVNQTGKSSTSLSIGLMVGIGLTMLCVGLFLAFSLNAIYTQQTNYLSQHGLQVNNYAFGLDNLIFLISTGALLAILGAYSLVLGCLNQFSAKTRIAFSVKDSLARAGNGLISGGIVWTSLLSANLIRQSYKTNSAGWHGVVLIVSIAAGLTAIAIGAFLIRRSYLHSKLSTKL